MKSNSLKRILAVFLPVMMILFATPIVASADTSESIPLIAAQDTVVGEVIVSNIGDQLKVEYHITDTDWYLDATHTYIGTAPPAKNAPGKFPYSNNAPEPYYDLVTETITIGTEYYIAAHAVVVNTEDIVGLDWPTVQEICADLPTSGDFTLGDGYSLGSPFTINIFNDTFLNGNHLAWCIDHDHGVDRGPTYSGNFYCSYGDLPDRLITGTVPFIDYPENLDLVNWLINNHDGLTPGQTQNVIWKLLDSTTLITLAGPEITAYVEAFNHDGFVPDFSEGDVLGIIVEPLTRDGIPRDYQAMILEFEPEGEPEYQDETAWAIAEDGIAWSKSRSWGRYFTFTPI